MSLKSEFLDKLRKQEATIAAFFASELIINSMEYYRGRPDRLNRFRNSDLIKSITAKVYDDYVEINSLDYIEDLDSGRPKFTKKVPIEAILNWLSEMGMPRDNEVAYGIQNSIYKKGVKPRNFIEPSLEKTSELIDELVEQAVDEVLTAALIKTVVIKVVTKTIKKLI